MKTSTNLFLFLFLFIGITSCGSCGSGKMSNEEAEKLRKKELQEKFIESYNFEIIKSSHSIGERRDEVLPKINKTPFGQLTEATGWMLCDGDQWIGRKNRIVKKSASTSPNIIDSEGDYGLGQDNFISYKLYDMEYGDRNYMILIKDVDYGRYMYPNTYKGWYKVDKKQYWVMDKEDLNQLASIKDKEPKLIEFKVFVSNDFLLRTKGLDDIEKDIVITAEKKPDSSKKDEYEQLDLIIYKDSEQDKVMFLFKGSYYMTLYDGSLHYMGSHSGVNELKDQYYETTVSNFSKFMKLPE